jgi:hypothetical protein
VIFQDIGFEMLDFFIYCIGMLVYIMVVYLKSLDVGSHKGHWCFIVLIILLGEYCSQGLVISKGIKETIFAKVRVSQHWYLGDGNFDAI